MMKTIELQIQNGWQFRQAGNNEWRDAVVPGTVHSDLKRHGIIPDPFYRKNEDEVQWVEEKDWEYRAFFTAGAEVLLHDTVELVFDGLDTYADVFLNGQLIMQSDNMFAGHTVRCKKLLRTGENELRIYFHSAVVRGLEKLRAFGHLLPAQNELAPEDKRTNVFTRKAPFHYGWDWGPRLVTSGIWRPLRLLAWSGAKIVDVYLHTESIESHKAAISVILECEAVKPGDHQIMLLINGKDCGIRQSRHFPVGTNTTGFEFQIENPLLWWPNGLGNPHLYDFEFQLHAESGYRGSYHLRYGVRTLELIQNADEAGHSFYFEVNGLPVFMKGANIIPSETLTPEAGEEQYRQLTDAAVKANMNMLRVWGGAIYEEDRFYELCDEHGLLVWQDFMFACSLQPPDGLHLENIRREAAYNIRRLRNHACLALWCGNNENLLGWHKWGWQEMFEPEMRSLIWKAYVQIFHEILPSAVAELDPKNAYWPSSPATIDNQLADRKSGDEHDWTVWFNQKPYEAYWENVPRFVSEWGLQAFPGMATIRTFATETDLALHSEVMRHRQRSRMDWLQPGWDGNDMIQWYVRQYFNEPPDFEHLVYLSQLMQASAYKTAIEAHRSAMPHCMGSLYWQLNDCWPTVSWASVDYFYRWKASHYAVKKAFAPLIITAKNEDGKVEVFTISDHLTSRKAKLSIEMLDFFGNRFFYEELSLQVEPNTGNKVFENDFKDFLADERINQRMLLLSLVVDDELVASNCLYFVRPKFMELPRTNIRHQLNKNTDGYELILRADSLVFGLQISIPDPDAVFSDNYFDLLPGRPATINISSRLESLEADDVVFRFL
jgi:beta-mannosidase